jgi:hypothetical protein
MTHKPERHMVTIETERTGRIVMTPDQFDLLMEAAIVGLDGYEGPRQDDADALWDMIAVAHDLHSPK